MSSGSEALRRLREGNRRFIAAAGLDGTSGDPPSAAGTRGASLDPRDFADGQEPIAVVLGCSDSRVPVETIFDQGLGDLFVIRVAGNVVTAPQLGSVEFAVERLGTRLVVVLGHSNCGAVLATFDEVERPTGDASPNLRAIVERIRPSVESALEGGNGTDRDAAVARAVRGNVRAAVRDLRRDSDLVDRLIREDGLLLVGAEYSLETGVVDVFDMPEAGP